MAGGREGGPQRAVRAAFVRGGTSKGLVLHARDLPPDRDGWVPLLLAMMGSPDPAGRQLDGMGGGLSSLSKACVVGPPTREDADVDYTFAQVGIDRAVVDFGGNCGNMASAIGPFAVDEGLVARADGDARVRIHNTNTGKLIVAHFEVRHGRARVDGGLALDGVAGTGAPIRLEFRDLGGARTGRLLPTGRPLERLALADGRTVEASLVDAANPCVFVDAAALGRDGTEPPEAIERDAALMADLEALRRQASVAMGLAATIAEAGALRSVPFVGLVAPVRPWTARDGRALSAGDAELSVRMLSSGQPHRAIPITSALCAAVATRVAGTVPHRVAGAREGPLRIGHASGTVTVEAVPGPDGVPRHASVHRTARRLFQGEVMIPAEVGTR